MVGIGTDISKRVAERLDKFRELQDKIAEPMLPEEYDDDDYEWQIYDYLPAIWPYASVNQ